jgi:ABC-type uncharacterized transport system substrate-binding protein
VVYERATTVNAGDLLSYGVSLPDLDRRAATYVDKILKGSKPADLPVEQSTKFELVINLKAAKQIAKSREANRRDDSVQRAGESGQGHSIGVSQRQRQRLGKKNP